MFHINISTINIWIKEQMCFTGLNLLMPESGIGLPTLNFDLFAKTRWRQTDTVGSKAVFFCLCDKKQKSKFWEITRDVQGFNVKPWWLEFGSVCGCPQHYTPSTVFQSCFSRHTFVSHLSKGTDGAIPVCPVWTLCPGSQFLHITAL